MNLQAKTLHKDEQRILHQYISYKKPKIIMELGHQYGLSAAFFIDTTVALGLKTHIHSWDVMIPLMGRPLSCSSNFSLHLENITGKEKDVLDFYKPDFLFLDAHAYKLTRNLMKECLHRGIDFVCHDVRLDILADLKKTTNNFQKREGMDMCAWEVYLLGELIHKDLWEKDNYEDDLVRVSCYRQPIDKIVIERAYGIAVIESKQ
jgi:hypothetical protein